MPRARRDELVVEELKDETQQQYPPSRSNASLLSDEEIRELRAIISAVSPFLPCGSGEFSSQGGEADSTSLIGGEE